LAGARIAADAGKAGQLRAALAALAKA